MRTRLLGLCVVVLGLLNLVVLGMDPARAAGGPIIIDPEGDATQFVVETDLPSEVSEPRVDIVSADIGVTPDSLFTVVTVKALSLDPPPGSAGQLYRWYFTYGGMEFHTRAGRTADGAQLFRLYDPANTNVPCPGCTGSFDVATSSVRVNVPLVVLNAKIAELSAGKTPPIGEGAELSALEVLSQRQIGAAGSSVTPTADIANADRNYRVGPAPVRPPLGPTNPDEKGDAVVIAVVDFNIVPNHWDFDAAHMPQHLDGDSANDLPLDQAPHTWLPGFPAPGSFTSYEALPVTLSDDPDAKVADLAAKDKEAFSKVPESSAVATHYRWLPDTKIIGAIDFGGSQMLGTTEDHGVGVTSVSAGNLHGTCPECLVVFVNIDGHPDDLPVPDRSAVQAALDWTTSQPWIDVVTNSYGVNLVGGYVRDNVWGDRGTIDSTRSATERGQTVFFSAGNGIENGFILPNTTYGSSVKGPDWMMTVGAITPAPDNANYSGAGKPVDLSGIGSDYPSAYTSTHVNGTGPTGFSGTSNATPTVAGHFARALYTARASLPGASRAQEAGVVAVSSESASGQPAFACGEVRADCELGDGALTAQELRTRLLLGAQPTSGTVSVGGLQNVDPVADERFANEGHGAYTGRQTGQDAVWMGEYERIVGPLVGRAGTAARPAGEREWMTVDSFCRQHLWGTWGGGYFQDAASTPLPGPDQAYPIRSLIETGCPALVVPFTP